MAGYSKKTLAQKLGLQPHFRLTILHAPAHYIHLLTLSPHRNFFTSLSKNEQFIHYFATEKGTLEADFPSLKKALAKDGMLWISWPPRRASRARGKPKITSDLTENIVREIGLKNGLVDVKVCAIDDDWSGLKFIYRLKDR